MSSGVLSTNMYRCVLAIAMTVITSVAIAQVVSEMSLEELLNVKVVSATRKEGNALRLPAVVTVVTGEELARWGAENLADGLRFVSGVQSHQAPGDFPQYDVTVRGNSADFMNIRTLFLIDGVQARNPNAGFDPSWMPISAIKRVEIVKGPASSLYGANAFGGVINIITKSAGDAQSREASVGYTAQHDHVSDENIDGGFGHINFGQQKESWEYFTSGQYFGKENAKNSYLNHEYRDVFGKVSGKISERDSVTLSALLSSDRNDIAVTNTDRPIKNKFFHTKLAIDHKIDENTSLGVSGYYSEFEHVLDYNDGSAKYDNSAHMRGVNTQYTTAVATNHEVIVGAEHSGETGYLKPSGWSKKDQNTTGVYAQHEYSGWSRFSSLLGVRYDSNSEYGGAFSPRAGLSFFYNENTTLYASVGRGFRAPVFNETQINAFGKIGNPDLEPEYTTTYEVGVKSIYLKNQNNLSIFREDISDKIEPVDSGGGNSTFRNGHTASITGVELEGAYLPKTYLKVFYNMLLLTTNEGDSDRIERAAETKAVVGINWILRDWMFEGAVIYEGDSFLYNASNPSIPTDYKKRVFVKERTIGNVQVTKSFSEDTSTTLYISNIADHKYKQSFSAFLEQDGLYIAGRTVGLQIKSSF